MDKVVERRSKSVTDIFRSVFKQAFEPIAAFLTRLGIYPNTITILGLAGHFIAAYLVVTGQLTIAGILLIVIAPFDFLDGMMARMRGESTRFGAFVDSVTDRYSELVIFGGLLLYFIQIENWLACALTYLAASGSILVSYIRARAESLHFDTSIGILTRLERYLVLIPALIFNIPVVAMWIIAILANLTALQRIHVVRQQRDKKE
ncbi:MAG: CDP-alcohol phosphatidyltransferase family protein [Anaerolineaceae bacterium]